MLESLFRPRSVAVIGASTKELSIGNRVIRNLVDFGFKGPIYPINPKADQVRGIKAYKSIMEVPDGVDVVHMVIPAKFVPQAVEECGRKKVQNIIINSGGFKEVGPEGEAIEKDFLARAAAYGIRILGPNCQGIINTDADVRAYCNFTFTRPDVGHISIVALSGGVAELIHQGFAEMGIGTRIYASNGNACDVSIPEIIRYLGDDEGTRVIVTYVEGLRDGANFLAAAAEVAAKKPILAMKAGRTAEGAKAASSHTGGLARQDMATACIFKKAGVLTFDDEGELIQAAAAFATQPIAKGNRVGIITNTGGPAVIATDVMVDAGCSLPPLSERTRTALKQSLYPEASVNNPVDVLATGNAAHYRACMDAMMDDDNYDAVFVNFVTPFFVDTESIALEIAAVNQQRRKPLVCNLMTDRNEWAKTAAILQDGGVPCFSLPGQAARAMSALIRYHVIQNRATGTMISFDDLDHARARTLVENALAAGRCQLAAHEVYGLLEAYGIPIPSWRMAASADQAVAAAAEIGFPVVVKADAPELIHKSDLGGVAVNLADAQAVSEAVTRMTAAVSAAELRFLIQKYQPGDQEVIIGAKAQEDLSPLVMFGMGGVYVEVLKDVVFALTPLTDADAREMLTAIQMAPLLAGVRGQAGVDRALLAEIIQRVARLVTDLPMIREMDLNPVTASAHGAWAVDARISLEATP